MYYSISGSTLHPNGYLSIEESYEYEHDAGYEDFYFSYRGNFVADDLPPDCLVFLDYVKVSGSAHVFSEKFRNAFEELVGGQMLFSECSITYCGTEIQEVLGGDVGKFFVGKPTNIVEIVDADVKPISFWPKLKKFKLEEYVITRKANDNFHVMIDEKLPGQIICTQKFVDFAKMNSLEIGFNELPCVLEY